MLSKEEIKQGLTEELGKTIIANECGLSTNDFSKSIEILENTIVYIDQVETDKQKLIEKLEKVKQKDEQWNALNGELAVWTFAQEILEIGAFGDSTLVKRFQDRRGRGISIDEMLENMQELSQMTYKEFKEKILEK